MHSSSSSRSPSYRSTTFIDCHTDVSTTVGLAPSFAAKAALAAGHAATAAPSRLAVSALFANRTG